jgi:hypothetical protein
MDDQKFRCLGFYLNDLFFVFIFTKNYFFLPITAFLGKLGFGYYDIVVLKFQKMPRVRRPAEYHHLNDFNRGRIIGIREAGLSVGDISQRVGCSVSVMVTC